MSIQVLGALAGAAASAGILAAMLGILAANILKDVSDQCCQCWLAGLGGCSGRDKPISPIAQGSWAAGLGWAGGGAGLRPVRGGGSLYRPAAAGTVSVVSTPPAAPRCVPRHRPARGHENRSLSSLITAASPQPHRRRYRHLTPPLLLSPQPRHSEEAIDSVTASSAADTSQVTRDT